EHRVEEAHICTDSTPNPQRPQYFRTDLLSELNVEKLCSRAPQEEHVNESIDLTGKPPRQLLPPLRQHQDADR
ncbi:hypothetical protein, partial [Enterobacter hormaechei]|uniref:hypothetical protein n=1 Tax=Enterobacter hormaechei TaxID=158836 RepID=UPI002040D3CA